MIFDMIDGRSGQVKIRRPPLSEYAPTAGCTFSRYLHELFAKKRG